MIKSAIFFKADFLTGDQDIWLFGTRVENVACNIELIFF